MGCGATFVVALGLVKLSLSLGIIWKLFIFLLFVTLVTILFLLFMYLWDIHTGPGCGLELDESGLIDRASFCDLGSISITSVANIRFVMRFNLEFLMIEFFQSKNPILKKRGFKMDIYHFLFGEKLWVPLFFFKVSRVDLESQLIHLDRLLQKKEKFVAKEGSPNFKEAIKNEPLKFEKKISDKKNLPPILSVVEEAPPPLTQVSSERTLIIEKIAEIKRQVRENNFDLKITTLYLDHIAQFPDLLKQAPELIPSGVSSIRVLKQNADYEEVSFIFKGSHFTFALRRDIGESTEALLSVGLGGRVQLSLRVRVEIGELAPLEIESFVAGPWQEQLDDLILEVQRKGRMGEGHTTTDITGHVQDSETLTKTNLENLKNRFGI